MDKKGIYGKYIIKKADGSRINSESCYFVLKLNNDQAARDAMRIYADECGDQILKAQIHDCCDWFDNPPACTCGGGRDRDIRCPFHDETVTWSYGDSEDIEKTELQRQAEEIKELRNQNTNQAMLITEINDKMLLQAIKNDELRAEVERLKRDNRKFRDIVEKARIVVFKFSEECDGEDPRFRIYAVMDLRQALGALNEGKENETSKGASEDG